MNLQRLDVMILFYIACIDCAQDVKLRILLLPISQVILHFLSVFHSTRGTE